MNVTDKNIAVVLINPACLQPVFRELDEARQVYAAHTTIPQASIQQSMKTESKKLIFAAKDLTNQTVASESGLQIWLSKLGGVLCVVIILEFVLHLALPSSFLRSYELPLQARLVLLCQTWVVLTACGFSIAGLLTLTIWGTNYVAPKQVRPATEDIVPNRVRGLVNCSTL